MLPNSHPHLLVVYPVLTNEEMTTESQRYNCFTRNGGNAIPKHAGPEAKDSNPTAGLTLLWARNPFRGNFNHWQVSRKEAGQIFFNPLNTELNPICHLLALLGDHHILHISGLRVKRRNIFFTLFMYWFALISCYLVPAFELRILEIFC